MINLKLVFDSSIMASNFVGFIHRNFCSFIPSSSLFLLLLSDQLSQKLFIYLWSVAYPLIKFHVDVMLPPLETWENGDIQYGVQDCCSDTSCLVSFIVLGASEVTDVNKMSYSRII